MTWDDDATANAAPEPTGEHAPVMLHEVLEYLDPTEGETIVDCTLGGGGHALEICRRIGPTGRLIGIDQDASALARARKVLDGYPVTFVHENARHLSAIITQLSLSGVDGVLFDLGVSSFQFDTPERGFSFRADAPLDMRMDVRNPTTAADLVNRMTEDDLVRLFYDSGYGRWARKLARAVITSRNQSPITTTARFADIFTATLPAAYRSKRIHPSTQAFNALRVVVNDEIAAFITALSAAAHHSNLGCRIVVIAFNSQEDREVKRNFQSLAGKASTNPPSTHYTPNAPVHPPAFRILTKKPLTASPEEVRRNPRSRSAKLRAVERIATDPDAT